MSKKSAPLVLVPLDAIDQLAQIRDELQVVWCALLNPTHGEECIIPIAEHVNGLHWRMVQVCKATQGKGGAS